MGLFDLSQPLAAPATTEAAKAPAPPQFKQYREDDGRFYFKLVDGDRVLLQGIGHESPRDAGRLIARIKQASGAGLRQVAGAGIHLGEELVGHLGEAVAVEELVDALARFAEVDA